MIVNLKKFHRVGVYAIAAPLGLFNQREVQGANVFIE